MARGKGFGKKVKEHCDPRVERRQGIWLPCFGKLVYSAIGDERFYFRLLSAQTVVASISKNKGELTSLIITPTQFKCLPLDETLTDELYEVLGVEPSMMTIEYINETDDPEGEAKWVLKEMIENGAFLEVNQEARYKDNNELEVYPLNFADVSDVEVPTTK